MSMDKTEGTERKKRKIWMVSFVIEIFGGLDREDEQLKEAEKEQPERKEEP